MGYLLAVAIGVVATGPWIVWLIMYLWPASRKVLAILATTITVLTLPLAVRLMIVDYTEFAIPFILAALWVGLWSLIVAVTGFIWTARDRRQAEEDP